MPRPSWEILLSANCPATVDGSGWQCMIAPCRETATGHAVVNGGLHDGRCLAIICPHHATEEGYGAVKEALIDWAVAGMIDLRDGGPGRAGEPEVWHGDHWDPMPRPGHDAGT